ncbi:nucleotidyl transferase AbiEii/AbiGii toxin family protein [Legionella israelensis]|uniref:nucleotidyl transferase AbiEii/AbiGii toxin family protein n=1 Tax=Legionella israelensis TaxID=454 RepID=UPI00117D9E12|nr:nucleotidyl transferase AbiEii/AbiGii toxin family protein [Legionella israelensis]QDP73476.1 nucleotidyl transferase AbiEii/AbiGii toxin family protein [Legionella israelensis]
MKELLEFSPKERQQVFEEATARSTTIKNPIIIEKDFWVCWTLNQIFTNAALSPHVIFKGGTSLSKCYNIIQRFSEDIDLTLSKTYIGIDSENDPAQGISGKQQKKRLDELSNKVKNKVGEEIKPILMTQFEKDLSNYFDESEWQLELDEDDDQSLKFHYPTNVPKKDNDYIQSAIKLEFGARGDISPFENKNVTSYCQQLLPELGNEAPEITVPTLLAKRTYWEKITLLHAEYHRSPKKPLPRRLFRHYYDIVMLDKKNITQEAMQDITLLEDVRRNKSIYFPAKWANYDEAVIGSLRLYPNEAFMDQLKADHTKMVDMFFGNAPDFDETLEHIKRIEKIVNNTE